MEILRWLFNQWWFGFIPCIILFGLMYNSVKPKQGYTSEQIREAEAKLRIKWAEEEKQKQNLTNPSARSSEET
ncbi:MAG: hypothetical protein J1F12_06390 [Muribaculaceae bacterium]|nr:hypothetical protein [Muribaculaceae bacterium]